MAKSFPGFSPKALNFFRELQKNNDRTWFTAHKELFETEVRQPMIELTGIVCDAFRKVAADYLPEKPEKAIYRIYRDTRFSKDKTPYKTHIGAHLQHRRIPKNAGSGFYFEVSHRAVGIGGGLYMTGPEQLQALRRVLETKWEQFAKICSEKSLVKALGPVQGERAARVPKSFDPQSPAGDWLRYKQIYFYMELPAKTATSPALHKEIITRLRPLMPFNGFINQAIIEAVGDEGDGRPIRPEAMF